MTGKPPMSGTEAREIVETMKRETKPAAMRRLLTLAIDDPFHRLSPVAVAVYRRALADMQE